MEAVRAIATTLAISCALFTVQSARADDLADLQGTWVMEQMQNGVVQRVTKTIKDKTETVEVFVNGVLTQKHVVDFTLDVTGPVKIFRWENGQIVGGPNKGQKLPDGKFLFRLEDKTWIGVHGLFRDDKGPLTVEVYKRPLPAPAA